MLLRPTKLLEQSGAQIRKPLLGQRRSALQTSELIPPRAHPKIERTNMSNVSQSVEDKRQEVSEGSNKHWNGSFHG